MIRNERGEADAPAAGLLDHADRADQGQSVPLRLLSDGDRRSWHLTLTPEFEAAGIEAGDIVSFSLRVTDTGPVLIVTQVPDAAVADHGANERRVISDDGQLFVSPPAVCVETAGGSHRGFRIDPDEYDPADPLMLESAVVEGRVKLAPLRADSTNGLAAE